MNEEQALIEALADAAHASWSHWMGYLFSRCEIDAQGRAIIPAALVERWQRQMGTPYDGLSESEKQSDREQATRYLPLFRAYQEEEGSA